MMLLVHPCRVDIKNVNVTLFMNFINIGDGNDIRRFYCRHVV